MPEHRAGTPGTLSILESFLWHDFEAGLSDWRAWLLRKMPDTSKAAAEAAFRHGMQLHSTLRSLQAANSGILIGKEAAASREKLNRLIARYRIQPRLGEDREFSLTSDSLANPVVRLILMALEALQSGLWRRFKLCHEPTCRASYYDASKAAAKTWCSMETCGSRNKMRRYRAKV